MIYFEDLEVGAETTFGHYDVTREECSSSPGNTTRNRFT